MRARSNSSYEVRVRATEQVLGTCGIAVRDLDADEMEYLLLDVGSKEFTNKMMKKQYPEPESEQQEQALPNNRRHLTRRKSISSLSAISLKRSFGRKAGSELMPRGVASPRKGSTPRTPPTSKASLQ
eukprot:TRINITY_DN966_c1_g3_i2.p1 TRINITY_DN966_c1_g3~~TRINITY_DN966_c1_g3_i2.p1  ORF type:complete len:127 (-),score=35.35 TRINITY_DN966_c1_g3_i2:311-691(-)